MKELSTEEKAKRYDDAIKRAKELTSRCIDSRARRTTIYRIDDIEEIFPELIESEDEKVRKWIISDIKYNIDNKPLTPEYKKQAEKAIAWLEKQDKQKPADKVEHKDYNSIDPHFGKLIDKVDPKFKVGDWITFYGGNPFKILKVEQEQNGILNYLLLDQNGHDSYYNKKYVDENARLWTIQNAKDGDILSDACGNIGIYYERHSAFDWTSYCSFGRYFQRFKQEHENEKTYPATKEQCELLFSKMKEAGYEWDAEKKELKKNNSYCQENCKGYQETGKCFADGGCDAKRKAEQNSAAWSEEDETRLTNIIIMLKEGASYHFIKDDITKAVDWLKTLKERVQSKREWSKEDDKIYQSIMDDIVQENQLDDKQTDWLKSLKLRVTWKPTEEQMRYLLKYAEQNNYDGTILTSLYNDLKKF